MEKLNNEQALEYIKKALTDNNVPLEGVDMDDVIMALAQGDAFYADDIYEVLDDFMVDEDEYSHIEQEGGGEGGAEDCHAVFKIRDKFFRVYYYYYSYQGYDYGGIADSICEVKPQEKLVVVYE